MKKKVVEIGGNLRVNGISSLIVSLNRELKDEFEFIYVNTAEGKDFYRNEVERLGGKVYDVRAKGKGLARALAQARQIRKIIRAEQPIAVHSHYWSNNGLYLLQAYKEGVPVRISHCHQSGVRLPFGKKIAKYFSNRMTKRYATHRLACSDYAREFLYGNDGETVFNAVSYAKFNKVKANRAQFGLDEGAPYFLFVGRLCKQKNLPFLLDVAEQLKGDKVNFLLVGQGDEEVAVRRVIAEKGLTNVRLLTEATDVAALMSVCCGLLLPSLHEGLPITLLEAQAAGLACLASEHVTREAQMGLVRYLPLEVAAWKKEILSLCTSGVQRRPCYKEEFDVRYLSALFEGIYSNASSEEWLQRGREYSLGSRRFNRSKALSVACFKRAHLMGDVRGTFHFALAHFEGNGVDKNRAYAKQLVDGVLPEIEKRAATSSEYRTLLGDAYSFGLGKEQSYATAFELYLSAAKEGNLEAMCDLGYMYLVGQGVERNEQKSFEWWLRSADLGYVHSMRDVGQSLLSGCGCKADAAQAVKYFKLASENNYSHGTADLARCYLDGVGVEKNVYEATRLLLLALQQDDERTMRDLFAMGADVEYLQREGKLRFLQNDTIDEIGVQNSYNGTLCVADRIRKIDPNCFYASEIKKIFVEKDNPVFSMRDGALFDKSGAKLLRFPPKSAMTEYVVPSGVTEIAPHAFQNCRNLRKVVLPNGLKVIADSAFDDCKRMKEINLPQGLAEIGDWAFHGCDAVEKFLVPRSVEKLGKYAFGSCEELREIAVEDGNEAYVSQNGALYNAEMTVLLQYPIGSKQTAFELPQSVKEIAFRALSDARNLQQVDCSNANKIGQKAFYCCNQLRLVRVKQGAEIGERAFDNCHEEIEVQRV